MERVTMMGIEFLPHDVESVTSDKLIQLMHAVERYGFDGTKAQWVTRIIKRIILTCPPKSSKVMLWALWNSEPWVLTGVMWRFNECLKEYEKITANMIERIVYECVKAGNKEE